jgi:parallel beta-helix repeat protein
MKRLRTLFISLTLVAGGALGICPAPAHALSPSSVTCGSRITTDTALDRDLVDCPGHGLVIGADNITLDLNGHLLDGDGTEQTACTSGRGQCDVGVSNLAGHTGIGIKGGSIRDFSFGVYLLDAPGNSLSNLTVSGNLIAGAELRNLTGGRLESSTITHNGLTSDGAGVNLSNSTGLVIEGNAISQSGKLGIHATDSSSQNNIISNHFADNPESGILLNGAANTITENSFVRNGAGIAFEGDRNTVSNNMIADVPWCGYAGCSSAIQVTAGHANQISSNVIQRSPVGIDLESYEGRLEGTLVSSNIVDSTQGTGIAVDVSHGDGTVVATVLERNVVTRGGTDGFDIQSASTTLSGNVAVGNGGLGIRAVAGVIDGAWNYAAGNKDPRQCTHVRCDGKSER